jgi:hypothetical protein
MTLAEIIAVASQDSRVCPQPLLWNRLWELLPNRRRRGTGWDPPIPLILAAWNHASDLEKRERFHLHLKWADTHGALPEIANLILSFTDDEWYTEN